MKDETRQEISAAYAKDYTDWMVKTGGYAKDMTLRDHFAGLAMQGLLATGSDYEDDIHGSGWNWVAAASYAMADAMLKERSK
jgi:cell division protein FtsN